MDLFFNKVSLSLRLLNLFHTLSVAQCTSQHRLQPNTTSNTFHWLLLQNECLLSWPARIIEERKDDILWFFPGRSEFLAVSDVVESLSDVSRCLHSYRHLTLIITGFIHVVRCRRRTGSTVISPQVALLCYSLRLTLAHQNMV